MGVRRRGRELALQALYQREITQNPEGPDGTFWAEADTMPETEAFARELVAGVCEHGDRIDALISEAAEHWRLDRLARVDRCVLRLATYEILARPEIPVSVTLNEAIEIARAFGSDDSPAFVNGVLDRVARALGDEVQEEDEP